jgi:hypothetical protein
MVLSDEFEFLSFVTIKETLTFPAFNWMEAIPEAKREENRLDIRVENHPRPVMVFSFVITKGKCFQWENQ